MRTRFGLGVMVMGWSGPGSFMAGLSLRSMVSIKCEVPPALKEAARGYITDQPHTEEPRSGVSKERLQAPLILRDAAQARLLRMRNGCVTQQAIHGKLAPPDSQRFGAFSMPMEA